MVTEIKAVVHESINLWLPFLIINNIQVQMSEITTHETRNTLEIQVDFSLKRNPTILDSVQVTIGGAGE